MERSRKSNSHWLDDALRMLTKMRAEVSTTTGEGIRLWLRAHGLDKPKSPHAWGMLTMTAIKRGMLVDTGSVSKMTTPRSHARRTPVWRFAK